MSSKLKSVGFWLSVVLTLLGLAASNGFLGHGTALHVAGWIATILTLLGVHMLAAPSLPAPTAPAAPAAPTA